MAAKALSKQVFLADRLSSRASLTQTAANHCIDLPWFQSASWSLEPEVLNAERTIWRNVSFQND